MLQASSSAPSLAASPYASTMSAESAMLLREIDSLEWMIDGVCFEYTPWDRRRSVAKVTSVAVHKPLPHVWRAARRALSSKHFRDLLQRHLAPVSLSPKEFGALIDIFGGERGTIDSSDFAVFYKELGSIEKVRKTIARHYRNCSVVVTRKRREYRSMVVPLPPLSRPGTGSERPSRVSTAERGGRSSFDASDRASKLSLADLDGAKSTWTGQSFAGGGNLRGAVRFASRSRPDAPGAARPDGGVGAGRGAAGGRDGSPSPDAAPRKTRASKIRKTQRRSASPPPDGERRASRKSTSPKRKSQKDDARPTRASGKQARGQSGRGALHLGPAPQPQEPPAAQPRAQRASRVSRVDAQRTVRRRSVRQKGRNAFFGDHPSAGTFWEFKVSAPSVDEIEAEKVAFRDALTKLCASATQYDRLSLGRRGLKPMQQHLPRHVMSRLLFELFHVHLTHEEERALGNRFSSHSGDFVDCNALQDQFLQLARDGLREDRVGKSAGSNKKSDGPEEAQDVKARKAVDLMFGSESSFEDEEESMEELMSTLRKEIEDNLKERVGVNKYAVELNQHTTSNLVLTNLKRAKIQAREKQLTKDLNKYVRKVSDDIMSQWSQERAGSDPGRLVGDVQLALAALNGDDDEAETADLERSSILIHLKNAVSDKALKARFETISDELERERGLAMIDAWKDFGVLPMVTMAVVRERLRDNPDELRNVASMRLGGWLRRRRVQRARAAKIEELQSKKRSIQVEKAVRRIQNAWRAKLKANRERRIYGRRDLAALTLQSMWHRHCGKKLERQAELQGHELKKIGAIITIQAWFQRATARRHIRQLQRIRKRQRDHTMARKIQLRVRIVLSRFVLRAKKRDRKLEIYTSANTLQNKWRSRQQRKRWLEGLRQYKASTKIAAAMRLYLVAHLSPVVLGPIVLPKVLKHMNLAAPLVVEVHRCASLRSTDSALHAGTPSVFVTAYQQIEVELDDKPQLEQKPPAKEEESGALARRDSGEPDVERPGSPLQMPDPEERLTPRKSDAPKPNREHHVKIAHRQVATCHTEPAPRRTVTEWNESFVIGGLEGNGCLAFTVTDHLVTGAGSNEFMGQALLQLEKTRPLHAGASNSPARGKKKQRVTSTFTPGTHTMENIRLPLGVMRREVEVERGKLLHLKNRERLATGELYTTIRPAPSAYSVCSHMLRRVEIVLTSYSWKPSWVVLAFGVLRVYNARGEVEPRFEINCEHIIGVGYDVEDDTINVKVVGDKDYSFRIIVNEHKENDEDRGFIRRTWLRKLRRVCPKIVTNEFCQEEMSHDAFVQQGDLAATPVPMVRQRRGGRVLRT